jgi:hypothetical protein
VTVGSWSNACTQLRVVEFSQNNMLFITCLSIQIFKVVFNFAGTVLSAELMRCWPRVRVAGWQAALPSVHRGPSRFCIHSHTTCPQCLKQFTEISRGWAAGSQACVIHCFGLSPLISQTSTRCSRCLPLPASIDAKSAIAAIGRRIRLW